MAQGDIYQVRIRQQLHAQLVLNTLFFRAETADGSAELLAESVDAFLTASWTTKVSSEVKFNFIEVQPIVPFGSVGFGRIPTRASGTAPVSAAPGTIARVLSLRSGLVGRSKNGRVYIAGAASAELVGGVWTAAELAQSTSLAAEMLAVWGPNANTPTFRLGVWSRRLGGYGAVAAAVGFAPVVSIRTSTIPGAMYSRKVSVGV